MKWKREKRFLNKEKDYENVIELVYVSHRLINIEKETASEKKS